MRIFSPAQWQAIVLGGVIAGSVDIGAASLIYGVSPLIVLRAVASGVLGRASFHGGLESSAIGAALQILISVVAAAIYVAAAARFPILLRRAFWGGLVFGACVYVVMNKIVVPLSAAPSPKHVSLLYFSENMLAMFVFGWLIAFAARRILVRPVQAVT